jgi:WD40 repeat protein
MWFEMTEGNKQLMAMRNPQKCIYTSIFWDYQEQELYAADEKGYVYIINVYQEDKIVTKRPWLEKIKRIQIIEEPDKSKPPTEDQEESKQEEQDAEEPLQEESKIAEEEELARKRRKKRFLMVETDYGIKSFRIKKGVKTHEMEGHTESILKIMVIDPAKMAKITKEAIPDDPKVITCSFDNTILLWDFEKMEVITKMTCPSQSELSALTFLYNCCLVATGHEDGAIRLWNMEINSSVLLKCHESKKHMNTISCIHGTIYKEVEFLICGSYDGRISVWEISEKKSTSGGASMNSTIYPQMRHVIDNVEEEEEPGDFEILVLNFCEIEVDGQIEGYILAGGNNRKIVAFSIRTGLKFNALEGHEDSVTCMAIDGQLLITGADDCSIRLWNLKTFSSIGILGEHEERK